MKIPSQHWWGGKNPFKHWLPGGTEECPTLAYLQLSGKDTEQRVLNQSCPEHRVGAGVLQLSLLSILSKQLHSDSIKKKEHF